MTRQGRRRTAVYVYRDEERAVLFQVGREVPKAFWQRRPRRGSDDPAALRRHGIAVDDTWVWSLRALDPADTACPKPKCGGPHRAVLAVRLVLYRLPDLLAADPEHVVYIVEGEKDVEALVALGCVATTNPGGAKKWRTEYGAVLRGRTVVVLPDNDEDGRQHAAEVRAALIGIVERGRTVVLPNLPPKGDVSDWIAAGGTLEQLEALVAETPPWEVPQAPALPDADAAPASIGGDHGWWARAKPVTAFLTESAPELEFLEPKLLARGCLTQLNAPRGLGKTHVAHALAVKLAKRGLRVLLLDRDNPPSMTRKWLRNWGALGCDTLRVLPRGDVPSLMRTGEWKSFPPDAYDVVILDALDSATEGAGEQSSERISKAFAALLDIAHRDGGPALFLLANTVKSGTQGRGSGTIEDRGDLVYEVRDATGWTPSGKKAWWTELPSADRAEWAAAAERRTGRAVHRLAFTPSKCRIEIEPPPFVLEVNRTTEPWTLRDVTAEIEETGRASVAAEAERRVEAQTVALERLAQEVTRRCDAGESPLTQTAANSMLRAGGVPRDACKPLIMREVGKRWRLVHAPFLRGKPWLLLGVFQEWHPEKSPLLEHPHQSRVSEGGISPAPVPQPPEKYPLGKSMCEKGLPTPGISPAEPGDSPTGDPLEASGEIPIDALDPDGEEVIA